MYGLNQAHLAWHTKLCTDLSGMNFKELPSAPCVFSRRSASSVYAYVLVYVEDLLIIALTQGEINTILEELKHLYEIRIAEDV